NALERSDADHRIAPKQSHGPGRGTDQPEHHPQRGRLAGAVRPQIAVNVADVDRQIDAGDGGDLPISLDKPPNLDGRRARGLDVAHSARAAASAAAAGTEPSTV